MEINSGGVGGGFYTVSEAATVLGVGQRRVLEMLETREIEGERDPASSRWKIPKRAIHGLAPGEPSATKEPPPSEEPPVTDQDTVELQVAEEAQATEEMADEEGLLFDRQPPREDPTERSSVEPSEETRERIGELERLYERLQYQQEAEKASWQEDKRALLAAANREQQLNEALQKEVTKLRTELEESWGLTSKLEGLNDHLQHSQQAQKAEWRKERESLLAALDRERQHAEELQGEVQRLRNELQTERKKPSWRRLLRT